MATIRHIAIFSDNPHKLAEFYRDVFGLRITRWEDDGNAWMTDGYMDIALIYRRNADKPMGLHHWGFTLEEDEKAEVYEKLTERGLEPYDPRSSQPDVIRPYVEDAARDIDGNRYDLSLGMRQDEESPPAEVAEESMPR